MLNSPNPTQNIAQRKHSKGAKLSLKFLLVNSEFEYLQLALGVSWLHLFIVIKLDSTRSHWTAVTGYCRNRLDKSISLFLWNLELI